MTLSELIAKYPAEHLLVHSPSGSWTTTRVLSDIDTYRGNATGIRVAIRLADAGKALRALAVLDGVADAIILLAPSIPLEQACRILFLTQAHAIITDDAQDFLSSGYLNAAASLEEINYHLASSRVPKETSWILSTSGTSGEPKLVEHTLKTLTRTTKKDLVRGSKICWGLLYEWPRFAGLQTFLQATLSGSTLLAPAIDSTLEEKISLFSKAGCTHLSATPTMWRKIVMTSWADQLPLEQVSLGGEIADDRLLNTLTAIFPKARVTHIYASTEAGVGFSVNDRKSGFPVSYLSAPPAGISLRIHNDRLYVRNTAIRPRYIGTDLTFGTQDGWIDTGDNVRIEGERVYFFGRDSGIINVGGNKVHPEEVERILLQYPGVAAARAYGKRSPITGSLVVAEVVIQPPPENTKQTQANLKKHVQSHLEAYKVPALISVVSNIESNATGKIARK